MGISGENPSEGSDGEEEVYINKEDIIREVAIDDEGAFLLLQAQAPFISFSLAAWRLLYYLFWRRWLAAYYCLPYSDLPDHDEDDDDSDGMGTVVSIILSWTCSRGVWFFSLLWMFHLFSKQRTHIFMKSQGYYSFNSFYLLLFQLI
jgi:hypothetical protein